MWLTVSAFGKLQAHSDSAPSPMYWQMKAWGNNVTLGSGGEYLFEEAHGSVFPWSASVHRLHLAGKCY